MKRIISVFLACMLLMTCVFSLASCFGNINQKYADKVNAAAEKKDPFTYEKVLEDLGGKEEAIDATIDLGFLGGIKGMIIAVKDCKTLDDLKEKVEAEDTIDGLVVTIDNGKATAAEFAAIDAKKFESMIKILEAFGVK